MLFVVQQWLSTQKAHIRLLTTHAYCTTCTARRIVTIPIVPLKLPTTKLSAHFKGKVGASRAHSKIGTVCWSNGTYNDGECETSMIVGCMGKFLLSFSIENVRIGGYVAGYYTNMFFTLLFTDCITPLLYNMYTHNKRMLQIALHRLSIPHQRSRRSNRVHKQRTMCKVQNGVLLEKLSKSIGIRQQYTHPRRACAARVYSCPAALICDSRN